MKQRFLESSAKRGSENRIQITASKQEAEEETRVRFSIRYLSICNKETEDSKTFLVEKTKDMMKKSHSLV